MPILQARMDATNEPDPEDAVPLAEARSFCRSMENGKLLAEGQILCDQIGTAGRQGVDDRPDQSQKQHWHLLSLLEGDSVPEYTRRRSSLRIYGADEVIGRDSRAATSSVSSLLSATSTGTTAGSAK